MSEQLDCRLHDLFTFRLFSFAMGKLKTISKNHLDIFFPQRLSHILKDFQALWKEADGKWIMNINQHLSTLISKMLLLGYSLFATLITSSPFWNSLSVILSLITFKFKLLVSLQDLDIILFYLCICSCVLLPLLLLSLSLSSSFLCFASFLSWIVIYFVCVFC